MNRNDLIHTIETAFDNPHDIGIKTSRDVREAVEKTFAMLNNGEIRVAERQDDGQWTVNQWIKKSILLYFRLNEAALISGAAGGTDWWDKIPSKFDGMDEAAFRKANFRAVPGCIVRYGAYVAQNVVLMPSFINVGAYIGERSMIDTWATIGSCAQIGKNVHISGGVGIGGVLEPLQAKPVIIEDNCFIGARSEVLEGCIVREGAVLSTGVYISMSTKIINRITGEIHMGEVPPYAVVVPGSLPGRQLPDGTPGPSIYCIVIVKQVDAKTRSKTSINDLLRE